MGPPGGLTWTKRNGFTMTPDKIKDGTDVTNGGEGKKRSRQREPV